MCSKSLFYAKYGKRCLDVVLSVSGLFLLSPLLTMLKFIGFVKMKGNPFFSQERPGLNEKIFNLYKFRTMTNECGADGHLLPDEVRLTAYGRFLRSSSLDELPELFNILKGDLSLVGPRPLLVQYLPWYTEEEHHRHDVRPGLTGWEQINGRNMLAWNDRLGLDLEYIEKLSFAFDFKIVLLTIIKVFKKSDILEDTSKGETNCAEERRKAKKCLKVE